MLDACVLYPVRVRDLLLTLAAVDYFDPKWSDEVLDELRRNVLADHPGINPEAFDNRMVGAMRRAFPHACVNDYRSFVAEVDNDLKDQHVAAAAIAAGASVIVTDNVKDFGGRTLRRRGITVQSAATFVLDAIAAEPAAVRLAVEVMASRKKAPPITADDVIVAVGQLDGWEATARALGGLFE